MNEHNKLVEEASQYHFELGQVELALANDCHSAALELISSIDFIGFKERILALKNSAEANLQPGRFRFHAESSVDINALKELIPVGSLISIQVFYNQSNNIMEFVEITVRDLSLIQMIELCEKVEDGHLMSQSIDYADLFLGKTMLFYNTHRRMKGTHPLQKSNNSDSKKL